MDPFGQDSGGTLTSGWGVLQHDELVLAASPRTPAANSALFRGSNSDGDLVKRCDGLDHAPCHVVDGADAVHLDEDAAFGVLGHHGFGLLVVQVQAVADDGFVVTPARFLGAAEEAVHQFLVVGSQLSGAGAGSVHRFGYLSTERILILQRAGPDRGARASGWCPRTLCYATPRSASVDSWSIIPASSTTTP